MNAIGRWMTRWVGVATLMGGVAQPAYAQGRVQGTAYDSVAARPLDSAFVQLALLADPRVSRSATTDQQGRFSVDSLPPGAWLLSLIHPRIDSAGVTQLARTVNVQPTGTTRMQIALPSSASLRRRACGDSVVLDSSGFVHGQLTDARRSRMPVRGRVRLEWVDAVLNVNKNTRSIGYTRTPIGLSAESDSTGRFVACGVPLSGTIRARGFTADDSTGLVELQLSSSGIARLDLSIGPSRVLAVTMIDSSGTTVMRTGRADAVVGDSVLGTMMVRRGNGLVEGAVRMRNGAPVVGALITVPGTGLEVRADSAGGFRLADLPVGTYTLEARSVGFIPARGVVDIVEDGATDQLLVLDRLISLDTVMVRAKRDRLYDPRLAAFETRRKSGLGRYKGPQEIEAMYANTVGDILRTMAGIRIAYVGGREFIQMRLGAGMCLPEVFVDGVRWYNDEGDFDRFLYARDIRAVEVYSPYLPTPPEFLVAGSRCGVIAFLTGDRKR